METSTPRPAAAGFVAAPTVFLCLAFPVIAAARQESARDAD